MDQLWLPCNRSLNEVCVGDVVGVFNRRVAGWDGSQNRPVIELLGAGGHLPTVWNEENCVFEEYSINENMKKEASEELGTPIRDEDITVFGGYVNTVTHELVILVGVEIQDVLLPQMQEYAIQNIDEDTKGIYLGFISEVIADYRKNPEPYAGGLKAAQTNFPNQKELMDRVITFFEKKITLICECPIVGSQQNLKTVVKPNIFSP